MLATNRGPPAPAASPRDYAAEGKAGHVHGEGDVVHLTLLFHKTPRICLQGGEENPWGLVSLGSFLLQPHSKANGTETPPPWGVQCWCHAAGVFLSHKKNKKGFSEDKKKMSNLTISIIREI